MKTIHVKNIEDHHPGYKDRTLTWAKIHFKLVTNPKYNELPEIDRWRLVAFIILELSLQEPISFDLKYLKGMGFDLKKRPMSRTLLMLQKYVEVRNSVSEKPVTQSRVEESRLERSHSREIDKKTFNEARKIYPGVTRGLDEEFENFIKKHKDWRVHLPHLKAAIEYQIACRKEEETKGRRPEFWKHFKTWINERWWSVSYAEDEES